MLYCSWRPVSRGQPTVILEWMDGERGHQVPGLSPDLEVKTVSTWGEWSGSANQASFGQLWTVAAPSRVPEVTGLGAVWASPPTSAVSLGFVPGSPRSVSLFSGRGFFMSPVPEPYEESRLVVPVLSPGALNLCFSGGSHSTSCLQLANIFLPLPLPLPQTHTNQLLKGPVRTLRGQGGQAPVLSLHVLGIYEKLFIQVFPPPLPVVSLSRFRYLQSAVVWKHDSPADILSEGN